MKPRTTSAPRRIRVDGPALLQLREVLEHSNHIQRSQCDYNEANNDGYDLLSTRRVPNSVEVGMRVAGPRQQDTSSG